MRALEIQSPPRSPAPRHDCRGDQSSAQETSGDTPDLAITPGLPWTKAQEGTSHPSCSWPLFRPLSSRSFLFLVTEGRPWVSATDRRHESADASWQLTLSKDTTASQASLASCAASRAAEETFGSPQGPWLCRGRFRRGQERWPCSPPPHPGPGIGGWQQVGPEVLWKQGHCTCAPGNTQGTP